jgi:exosortase/archaeosortase family protein
MASNRLLHSPRFVEWGIRIDRAPTWWWLAAQAAALWPTWVWSARRMVDGSDDPLGMLALGGLALVAWQARKELRASPRLGWLALGMAGTLAATAGSLYLPPLLTGLVAVLALACTLLAFLPSRVAGLGLAGLAVLALPLLSSLQFYAGYPLRIITAEASRWLLCLGFEVQREGTALLVDGRLVIVDAPCSGVQMAWFGYFTACAAALWAGRTSREMLVRLPLVSAIVLTANVLRNAVLVACEGAGAPLPPWAHAGLGLLVLGIACAGIACVFSYRSLNIDRLGGRHAHAA